MADWWTSFSDPPQEQQPSAWKTFVGNVTHAMEVGGERALRAVPDAVGFVGDLGVDAYKAAKNAVNSSLHPDEPKETFDLPGAGPVSKKVNESYNKSEEDYFHEGGQEVPQERNWYEKYLGAASEGLAGGLVAGPRGAVSGVTGALAGQGTYDLTGNETAATIAGLAAGAVPFVEPHVTAGILIRKGANHPDFEALWNNAIIPDEGGGTIENPNTSLKGARGPAQVMPATAGDPSYGVRKSNGTPADDVRMGKQYFAAMLGKYGDPEKALAAYNAGPGKIDALIKQHGDRWYDHAPKETQKYVAEGMDRVYGGPQLQGPPGPDGLPTNGSARPIPPEDLARIMNDSEAAGLTEGGIESPPEQEPTPADNVVDFGQAREDAHADKARNFLDDKLQSAADIEQRVLNGEQVLSPEDATKNREIADQLHNMLPEDHAYRPRTAELQDIWRNIEDTVHKQHSEFQDNEVLTPAEKQDMDASAEKPIVDNTGYEKFTPNVGEPKSAANDTLDGATPLSDREAGGGGQEPPQEPPSEPPAGGEEPPSGPEKGLVAKLRAVLDRAEPLQGKQAKAMSAERSQRLGKAAGSARNLTGEARHNAALAALKGEYDKPFYPSIKDQFSPEEAGQLMDMIYEHPELNDFDKIAAGNGLKKLLGAEEMGIPGKSELEALKRVFPADLIDRLSKSKVFNKNFYDHVANVLNAPRTLMAGFDISAPGRQGIFLVGRKQFWSSIPDMFKAMPSEKAFKAVMDTIKSDPNYKYMIRGDVEFTGMHENTSLREERFQSNIADKIPGISHSERAYVAYLNKLRADVFSDLIKKGKDVGIDWDKNSKALKDLAKYVNTATGRGSVGQFQQAANILNAVFFSPRLMASRLRLLNPMFYVRLHPFVRREALIDLMKFAGITTTILGLAAAGGATVERDARSTDFGKIRIGKTRIELTGGFQPYIRLAAQLGSGQKKTQSGKIRELGEGQTSSGLETAGNFLVGKSNPIASFATDLLRTTRTDLKHGKLTDVTGQKHSIPASVASRFIPLVIQDMTDAMQIYGAKGAAVGIPSVVGLGVQTYQPYKKQTADQKKAAAKQEWWDKYK